MKLDTNNRFQIMYAFICIVFVGLFVRMSYMTIIQGDDFYSVAENKVYKKIYLCGIPILKIKITDKKIYLLLFGIPILKIK